MSKMGNTLAFPKITKSISLEQMIRISGAGNIHSDQKAAEKRGTRGPIVQGGQLAGYLNEMMIVALGDGFISGGELSVSFIYPVRPGDTIFSFGEVTDEVVVDGRTRVHCNIWLENQNGQKVTVGTASGFLP
ncbi:MAG: MaoC family dehydratase [Proteobacteria bacterium]|nr:MaoC family dehydratase [Pseudomonadota bacterium]